MGAIAFWFVMGIVVLLGLGVAMVGIVGAVLSGRKKRKGFLAVSIAAIAMSVLIVAFPVAFFGSIMMGLISVPDEFVKTGIVMEQVYEQDYQVVAFTADGTRYAKLESVEADFSACSQQAAAAFEYRPEGLLERHRWKNYYRLDNAQGIDLIWDGHGKLFCPETQMMAVLSYLRSNSQWVCEDGDGKTYPLSAEACASLAQYPPVEDYPLETVSVQKDKMIEYDLKSISEDGFAVFEYRFIGVLDGMVCVLISFSYDENGTATYTYIPYPRELGAPILADLQSAD